MNSEILNHHFTYHQAIIDERQTISFYKTFSIQPNYNNL